MTDTSPCISAIGTYLPTWGAGRRRTAGHDEDALTMAVAAGLAAFGGDVPVSVDTVVFVTRQPPLLEGGSAAPLLAGLGQSPSTRVIEIVGGAPAVLDAITDARPGTLVIGVDLDEPAAASAVLVGDTGVRVTPDRRIARSLPVTTRDTRGSVSDYGDPRLLRERGLAESLDRLGIATADAAAGLDARDSASICGKDAPVAPCSGAASVGFVIADLLDAHGNRTADGAQTLLAVEQAIVVSAHLAFDHSQGVRITRDECAAQDLPPGRLTPGSSVSISLSAYERAFDYKTRLEAARCASCGTLSFPKRYRCIECGDEGPTTNVALPRDGEVYSLATIRVPVPGLIGPYTVVIV